MEEVCSSSMMADAPSTAMLTSESPGRVYLGRFSFPFGRTIYDRMAGLAARVVRPAQRLSRDRDSDSENSSSRRNTHSISKPSLPYVHFSHPHRPFPKSPSICLLHGKRYHARYLILTYISHRMHQYPPMPSIAPQRNNLSFPLSHQSKRPPASKPQLIPAGKTEIMHLPALPRLIAAGSDALRVRCMGFLAAERDR